MNTTMIKKEEFIDGGRRAVLQALDLYVRGLTEHPDSRGWTDQELPKLFPCLDKHMERVAARLITGEEAGSASIRIKDE